MTVIPATARFLERRNHNEKSKAHHFHVVDGIVTPVTPEAFAAHKALEAQLKRSLIEDGLVIVVRKGSTEPPEVA